VSIHKLEYVLNAHIVGARIRARRKASRHGKS
jgi:hypothetical protein